nr:unnamed protein product [Digitaria exilis]
MATNAKSSSAGGAGAGASHGDLGRTISHHEQYHAFLTSLHRTSPGAMNVHQYQHQCPAGVIQAPVATMPQAPYSPQIATPPPSPFMEHHAQSQFGEIESDNSEEPDPTPASEIEDLNQDNGHIINVQSNAVNCQDYRMILRKDLTNSDVGNIGRIVLPKKDAEPNLPILEDKDGLMLEMDDFELPAVWKFKYRYWPNNKSRMYILEITGEFVKRHGLQAKDILIIYKNKKSGRYVARAVKAENIQVPECECIKAGNLSEECGFAVGPSAKKASV